MPTRVTLRQIATKTGLHFTTVSLALRNSPRLPQETREKVRKIAKEMGYQPDPMLAALNAYRVSKGTPHYKATIAWIDNWPEKDALLKVDEFRAYYQGATERANQLGYTIEEFWLNEPGMSLQKLYRVLKARNIQGLLLAPQPRPNLNPGIDFREYSAVTFGYTLQPSVLNVVTNHHFHTMHLIITRLYELGYRRIGISTSEEWDNKVGNSWLACALLFKWKYPSLTIAGPLLGEADSKATTHELVRKHALEVIIGGSETVFGLRENGYSIPKDVGVASLALSGNDNVISGVYQNGVLIGKKAVDVLVGMLQRGERGIPEIPVSTLVEGVWRRGTTLKKMKPEPAPKKNGSKAPLVQK